MDWRLKCVAFHAFRMLPFGQQAHSFAQRRLTRTLPRKVFPIAETARNFIHHVSIFREFSGNLQGRNHLEFGAGWDLLSNLVLYCYGIERQVVVDQSALARADMINAVVDGIRADPPPGAMRFPTRHVGSRFIEDLKRLYGIDYRAPADARVLQLPDGSVDLVSSTNTLEHIPPANILSIMREVRRATHAESVISMKIDYTDHYSHSDRNITPYNFLRYSDGVWSVLNPGNHYQNRLRHRDYAELFTKAGFRIVRDEQMTPAIGLELLQRVPIAKRFLAYSRDELAVQSGVYVLRPDL